MLCGQLYATKAVFTLNPTIAVFQVMALKALICFSVIAISQNTKLKYIMVDSVDRTCIPSLVFKTLQGSFGVFFTYTAIKTFQVLTVGIVSSFSPLIALVMATYVLNEKVSMADIVSLLIVISGIILILAGV